MFIIDMKCVNKQKLLWQVFLYLFNVFLCKSNIAQKLQIFISIINNNHLVLLLYFMDVCYPYRNRLFYANQIAVGSRFKIKLF